MQEIDQFELSATEARFFGYLRTVVGFPLHSPTVGSGVGVPPTRLHASPAGAGLEGAAPAARFELSLALERHFFDELWVERRELPRVLARLAEDSRLLALTGERGSGKSTLLRYIAHQLESPTPNSVKAALPDYAAVRADIFDIRLEIDRYRGTDRRGDLCAALFDSFEDRMSAAFELGDPWDAFRAASDPHFRNLRKAAKLAPDDFAGADAAIAEHPDEFRRAAEAFDSAPGLLKLDTLLHFIRRRTGRKLIFFVDNVDRHPQELQVNVAEHLSSLIQSGAVSSAVIALRPETYRSVQQREKGTFIPDRIELDPLATVEHDEAGTRITSPFFVSFLRKRLAFLGQASRLDLLEGVDPTYAAARLEIYRETLRHITDFLNSVEILADLVPWYNNSARSAGVSTVVLFRHLLAENEWNRESGPSVPSERLAWDRRFARSAIYRHMILDDDDVRPNPSAPMLFSRTYPSYAPAGQVPFLEFHLLAFLSRDAATIAQIREHAIEVLHTTAKRVDDALNLLWNGRGVDETGLIYVDEERPTPGTRRAGKSFHRTSPVHLLPAGALLLDHLAASCEYLFWSAMEHLDGDKFLPAGAITLDGYRHDRVRLETAITFTDRWITPALESYRRHLQQLGKDARREYDHFYPPGFIRRRIRRSLASFLQGMEGLPRTDYADLAAAIDRLDRKAP
jgi:hypothetical protein